MVELFKCKKIKLIIASAGNEETASEQLNKNYPESFQLIQRLKSADLVSSQESLPGPIPTAAVVIPLGEGTIPKEDLPPTDTTSIPREISPPIVQRPDSPPQKLDELDFALEEIPLGTEVVPYLQMLFSPANILDFFSGEFDGKTLRLPKIFEDDLYDSDRFKFFVPDSGEQEYLHFQISCENVEHIRKILEQMNLKSALIHGPKGCGKSLTSYFTS